MTPDELEAIMAKATPGPIDYDEPDNWHGIAARIHPVASGDVIAQVSLSGWGKRKGRAICEAIVVTHNAMPALLRLWRAAIGTSLILDASLPSTEQQRDKAMDELDEALRELENHR